MLCILVWPWQLLSVNWKTEIYILISYKKQFLDQGVTICPTVRAVHSAQVVPREFGCIPSCQYQHPHRVGNRRDDLHHWRLCDYLSLNSSPTDGNQTSISNLPSAHSSEECSRKDQSTRIHCVCMPRQLVKCSGYRQNWVYCLEVALLPPYLPYQTLKFFLQLQKKFSRKLVCIDLCGRNRMCLK